MVDRQKTALVCGAGGFIGSHMVRRLKEEGYQVRGVDVKRPEYSETGADEFILGNLTDKDLVDRVVRVFQAKTQKKYWENICVNIH